MRIAPDQAAGNGFGIGIDEKLVGVEAQAALGIVWAVDPVAIELPRQHIIEIAVPDILGPLRKRYALDLPAAVPIEQAELDLFRIGGKQCEGCSTPVTGSSQGVRQPGGEPHATAPGREKTTPGAGETGRRA